VAQQVQAQVGVVCVGRRVGQDLISVRTATTVALRTLQATKA
jgi:hypothetical protein